MEVACGAVGAEPLVEASASQEQDVELWPGHGLLLRTWSRQATQKVPRPVRSDLDRWSSRCFDQTHNIWPKHRVLQLVKSLHTVMRSLFLTRRDPVRKSI